MKLLLYCCKNPHKLYATNEGYVITDFKLGEYFNNKILLNGKIVAECDFEVEWYDTSWCCGNFTEHKGLEKSCLTKKQLFDYVKGRNEFYAIHIKNLHIFDKPKELSEFMTKRCQYAICSSCRYGKDNIKCATIDNEVDKAPQNMMYCYGVNGKRYVLISIKPEWLCKILNREKTIEVRKKVLKEMLE